MILEAVARWDSTAYRLPGPFLLHDVNTVGRTAALMTYGRAVRVLVHSVGRDDEIEGELMSRCANYYDSLHKCHVGRLFALDASFNGG